MENSLIKFILDILCKIKVKFISYSSGFVVRGIMIAVRLCSALVLSEARISSSGQWRKIPHKPLSTQTPKTAMKTATVAEFGHSRRFRQQLPFPATTVVEFGDYSRGLTVS